MITTSGSCARTSASSCADIARAAGDVEVVELEQAREPFAQQNIVVGNDDASPPLRVA